MAPNSKDVAHTNGGVIADKEGSRITTNSAGPTDHNYKWEIVWRNVILFVLLHLGALVGLYHLIFKAKHMTILSAGFLHFMGGMGITAGAHRLWAHRGYKARLPMRIILVMMNSLAFQNDIHEWVRDHRVHHKFTESDADPHNALRGFFFSHMGWLMVRKHPDVKEKGKLVDMSDLEADPVVMFQKKHYIPMMVLFCFFLPTIGPWLLWNETIVTAFYVCAVFRYTFTLHSTWLVNSAAHLWGMKPYDKAINPVESKLAAVFSCGEGWHNYHHTFPWDYATGEFGYQMNITTVFIDLFAWLGLAYDRKTVPREIVKKRALKFGDGSSIHCKEAQAQQNGHHHHHGPVESESSAHIL
jgi:stearoyl-CoA desaturase (delta-9 desaturase)